MCVCCTTWCRKTHGSASCLSRILHSEKQQGFRSTPVLMYVYKRCILLGSFRGEVAVKTHCLYNLDSLGLPKRYSGEVLDLCLFSCPRWYNTGCDITRGHWGQIRHPEPLTKKPTVCGSLFLWTTCFFDLSTSLQEVFKRDTNIFQKCNSSIRKINVHYDLHFCQIYQSTTVYI